MRIYFQLFTLLVILFPDNIMAQESSITISGTVKSVSAGEALPFVNVVLKASGDSAFVAGTITNEEGFFTFNTVQPDEYF